MNNPSRLAGLRFARAVTARSTANSRPIVIATCSRRDWNRLHESSCYDAQEASMSSPLWWTRDPVRHRHELFAVVQDAPDGQQPVSRRRSSRWLPPSLDEAAPSMIAFASAARRPGHTLPASAAKLSTRPYRLTRPARDWPSTPQATDRSHHGCWGHWCRSIAPRA